MDIRKDRRGFSLVELIITMAIMAIFAGAIIGAVGWINAGKTRKASAKLNNQISSIQTATMTQKGETYLYIYRTSKGIYSSSVSSNEDFNHDGTPDYPYGFKQRSELNTYLSNGGGQTKLCDSSVVIKGKKNADGSGSAESVTLTENNMFKIGYSKGTGAFTYSNDGQMDASGELKGVPFYTLIEMKGKEKFTIQLVKATGKHFIKED